MKNSENKHSSVNKVVKVVLLSLCGSVSIGANAALPVDATLAFDPGIVAGYYGTDVVGGSYFAMDTNGDGAFTKTERNPIEMNEGVRLGDVQPALQSHAGSPDGSEQPSIDLPWPFFGNTGMHQTTAQVVIVGGDNGTGDGTATLDFSGWGVTWNGIANIPLGGDAANFASDTGNAIMTCSSNCDIGDTYTLEYTAHVPVGDPSGFGGVHYQLHLEGTISDSIGLPPTKSVSINLTGGNFHECTSPEGDTVDAFATIITSDSNDIVSIDWLLDGAVVGSGNQVSFVGSLGEHTLDVAVNTVESGMFQDSKQVTVRDTQAPDLNVLFIDRRSGDEITEVSGNGKHHIIVNYDVTDLCDSEVSATGVAVPVHTIEDGSLIKIRNKKINNAALGVSAVNVSAEAIDDSGNRRHSNATLMILD